MRFSRFLCKKLNGEEGEKTERIEKRMIKWRMKMIHIIQHLTAFILLDNAYNVLEMKTNSIEFEAKYFENRISSNFLGGDIFFTISWKRLKLLLCFIIIVISLSIHMMICMTMITTMIIIFVFTFE